MKIYQKHNFIWEGGLILRPLPHCWFVIKNATLTRVKGSTQAPMKILKMKSCSHFCDLFYFWPWSLRQIWNIESQQLRLKRKLFQFPFVCVWVDVDFLWFSIAYQKQFTAQWSVVGLVGIPNVTNKADLKLLYPWKKAQIIDFVNFWHLEHIFLTFS